MNLSSDEAQVAYNCVAAVMRGFTTAPAPWAVQHLYDRLDSEFRMSRTGPDCCCGVAESEPETLISSRQAAAVLGYSKRHVNRIAKSLGGQDVDGVRVFCLSQVQEYAEGRNDRPGPESRAEAS
jgi:hypothetical protein